LIENAKKESFATKAGRHEEKSSARKFIGPKLGGLIIRKTYEM